MNPDDTQDVRVRCAKALEWTDINWYEDNAGPGFWNGYPPARIGADENHEWTVIKEKYHKPIPPYDTSTDAAMELVSHLKDMHFFLEKNPFGQWSAEFTEPSREYKAHAEKPAMAICLAFLAAKGLEP